MKVKFVLHTGYVGCNHEEIIDLDDDLTEDQIEELWEDWVWDQINGCWEVEK